MTLRLVLTLPVLLAGVPAPVVAQETFSMPAGCTAYVTVQKRGCVVSHLFRCEGDPAGYQRRADMTEAGLTYVGVIDAETQWIESYYAGSGQTDTLAPDPIDVASLSELMETGFDSWDFRTLTDGALVTRHQGSDRLTGRVVTIDGVALEETAFEATVLDEAGIQLWRLEGTEYISRDWRTFLSGTRTMTMPDETYDTDYTPVAFIFPGEPGFLGSQPRYDCSVVMSGLESQLTPVLWSE